MGGQVENESKCWYDGTLMLTTDGDSKVQPGTPVDENDHPKPLPGGGATTARTDVEIEGQDADQSDLSHTDNHTGESQQPAFRNAEQREITAVEDNGQEESDESESDSSDSEGLVNKMRNKYKKSLGKGNPGRDRSGRDSSSSSSSSSEEEYEAKSSYSSKSTHTSHKVVSSKKEVDAAAADTADDVSDIETDVEWPRRSEDETNNDPKQKINDALPPKPQKPKKVQGILSPKKQKINGPKKRASFKVDDDEDDQSDVSAVAHRDKRGDGTEKKKRNSNISKEKNYEIGIVAYEDGVEQVKEPLGLRAADRKKDDDQTSDIPEISVNKSGVTLFSDRVDDVEPCREHVTVGYEEEVDERGTESDVEGESAGGVGRGRGTSGSETSEDMVAQYAARLNELDERAGTEDHELSYRKNFNHGQRSPDDTKNGSREKVTSELSDVNESNPAAGKGQEVVPRADLPKILIDNTEAHMATSGQISEEKRLSGAEEEPKNMQITSDEKYNNVEVTLADINSNNPGGVTRRVSAGGESLLSVPCIEDKDCDVWTGGSRANQEAEVEVISPGECDTKMKPSKESSRDDVMQQQIPIILVEGGCQPSHDKFQDEERTRTQSPRRDSIDGSPGRTLSPDRIADIGQYKVPPSEVRQYRTPLIRHDRITSSDTESERNSSAEAAAGSVPERTLTSEDTGLYTEDKPSVALPREESQSVPTIITEHVD
ncbi:dentin sialophosphoprotein-like [Haliotis asinina]|uniref:dentin sialophosphoprotein-like n=1 Tax=Haliotis asinina TaxID=109174 RepID=UPI0035319209